MSETNQELTQQYLARTQAAIFELSGQLESVKNGSATSDAIEKAALELARLRKDFTDAIAFLPAYDQRQVDKQLKDVEAQLETLRSSAAPKSKFAFKRKAAKPTSSPAAPAQNAPAASPAIAPTPAQAATPGLSISGHSHEYLTLASLSSPWSSASDLTISDLDHCIVNLVPSEANADVPSHATFTALHVRNLSHTVLILPIIAGSALLHDMNNCVIALGSRQFRMHTSSQVDVYIAISSNPIIEHCSAIRFADYPPSLRRARLGSSDPTRTDPTSTLDPDPEYKSNYLAAQDFSHIRPTPSPNWSALPPHAAVPDGAWPLALSGGCGVEEGLQRLLPLPQASASQ
ncbi:tubulin binding cofactor C-domain-containing protein [Earliella scabrosa]|nr:tubulin binding cofactor C-domain-containing protein [Earliella scabrosa]